jgi:hypothetical protein
MLSNVRGLMTVTVVRRGNVNSRPGPPVCRSVGVMADLLAVCVEDDGSVVGSPVWRRKWDEICARRYRQIEEENNDASE